MQLVLQHFCWKTSWIVMLRVLPLTFKPFNNLIRRMTSLPRRRSYGFITQSLNAWRTPKNVCMGGYRMTGLIWVVKRATSLFNSFYLQQCCKTSCTIFVARFSVPLQFPTLLKLPSSHHSYGANGIEASQRHHWMSETPTRGLIESKYLPLQAGDVKVRICICCCGSVRL